jgi:TusA-related sulfurtransferase
MKFWRVMILIATLLAAASLLAVQQKSNGVVPKYDPSTEAVYKGTVEEVRDRQCPVTNGEGAHVMLKLADGKTIEVHLATTKFVKSYELVFNKGDQLEVTGVKVKFEDVDTIFAREIKRGNDTFVFRDKEGRPIW